MNENEQKDEKRETVADVVAIVRRAAQYYEDEAEKSEGLLRESFKLSASNYREIANRIEAAWKRERELLRSCARWILTHDIYGHMAQELLAECKKVLGDDGRLLTPKGDMA